MVIGLVNELHIVWFQMSNNIKKDIVRLAAQLAAHILLQTIHNRSMPITIISIIVYRTNSSFLHDSILFLPVVYAIFVQSNQLKHFIHVIQIMNIQPWLHFFYPHPHHLHYPYHRKMMLTMFNHQWKIQKYLIFVKHLLSIRMNRSIWVKNLPKSNLYHQASIRQICGPRHFHPDIIIISGIIPNVRIIIIDWIRKGYCEPTQK